MTKMERNRLQKKLGQLVEMYINKKFERHENMLLLREICDLKRKLGQYVLPPDPTDSVPGIRMFR